VGFLVRSIPGITVLDVKPPSLREGEVNPLQKHRCSEMWRKYKAKQRNVNTVM
jgi:hypothetical protein